MLGQRQENQALPQSPLHRKRKPTYFFPEWSLAEKWIGNGARFWIRHWIYDACLLNSGFIQSPPMSSPDFSFSAYSNMGPNRWRDRWSLNSVKPHKSSQTLLQLFAEIPTSHWELCQKTERTSRCWFTPQRVTTSMAGPEQIKGVKNKLE